MLAQRARLLAIGPVLLLTAASGGRTSLGIFGGWGAFRDASPARCFAIARPVTAGGASSWKPFASVASWPGRGARNQPFFRLSLPARDGARVTLSVGERRFALSGRGADAWAPDPGTDRAIVAAIRMSRSMSVETTAASGRPFADSYALAGAPTAIDAAVVGCLQR